jgi:phosphoserine phosphatase RsbU/P
LRNFSVPGQGPAQVLTIANNLMATQNDEGMFVTIFYGHYHVRTGELRFANGGHNPPFLVRKDDTMLLLGPPTGPIVGILPDAKYTERREVLAPAELLVLYTDGVTEACSGEDVLLGEEGLRQILAEVHGQTVEDICRSVLHRIKLYRSSSDQDDVTILALRRTV